MRAAEKFVWAMAFCDRARLRLTGPREKILRFLSAHRLPVSIEQIAQSEDLAGQCDETTVYRTVMLFREMELVRQINLPGKTSYFVLNVPGEPCDFLVCRCCGSVTELPPLKPVIELEREVNRTRGYTGVYHELEVYGVCPECQKSENNHVLRSKLPIRV
jgi:Fur family transcriptional regulator, ferric uptake regulator